MKCLQLLELRVMRKFIIKDFEHKGKKTTVEAQGIAEAMLEYLPWPTLEVKIYWQPSTGTYEVTDLKTDFRYDVFSV